MSSVNSNLAQYTNTLTSGDFVLFKQGDNLVWGSVIKGVPGGLSVYSENGRTVSIEPEQVMSISYNNKPSELIPTIKEKSNNYTHRIFEEGI
jgi:hypothetical protein